MSDDTVLQYGSASSDQRIITLDEKDFPLEWRIVQLGDVIDIKGGSQPPKSNFIYEPKDGYIRLLQIRDFGKKPVPTYVPKSKVTKFCDKNDVLIARYGASLGRIVSGMEGAYNVALAKTIFDRDVIFPKYLFYLLQTPLFQTPIHMISRSAQNGFNKGEINPIQLPLPPIDQQKCIVAEIEKQFSRLDEAVANLKRVKANLKRYKAAVLKAAVEGKLTEEWRKQNPDVEPADKRLERILAERREKWQGRGKYKEPVAPDTTDLPELPAGWVWVRVDAIAEIMLGKMLDHKKHQEGEELPYLRNKNVRWGAVDTSDLLQMFYKKSELGRYGIRAGDALVCEGGEPGRAAIWNGKLSGMMYQKALHRVRFGGSFDPRLLVFYLEYLAKSGRLKNWFTGSTIKHFTREAFSGLPLPVPPREEQKAIVEKVEKLLSIIFETAEQIDKDLRRSEKLRQSILKKAFSGQLIVDVVVTGAEEIDMQIKC